MDGWQRLSRYHGVMLQATMDWLWIILIYGGLFLAALGGLVCIFLTLLQLPGTWVLLLMMLVVCFLTGGGFSGLEVWLLIALTLMAVVGEIIEFIASAVGSRQAGGSKRGALVSLVGGVAGAIIGTFAIPIPIIGTLIGACLGAGIGSLLGDKWAGRDWQAAYTSGKGAALGKLGGTIAKVGVAGAMWAVSLIALFAG